MNAPGLMYGVAPPASHGSGLRLLVSTTIPSRHFMLPVALRFTPDWQTPSGVAIDGVREFGTVNWTGGRQRRAVQKGRLVAVDSVGDR